MTTLSPFKEGAVIQIAQGVLRGVGPMGPRGHKGDTGPVGPQGPPGPQPDMDPVGALYTTSTLLDVNTSGTWVTVPFTAASYSIGGMSELITDASANNGNVRIFKGPENGTTVLFTPTITIAPAVGLTESFRVEIGLFLTNASTPFVMATFDHENGGSASTFPVTFQALMSAETIITTKVRVAGATVNPRVSFASLATARTGGTIGPQGIQGVQGIQGPPGAQGIQGDSGSGYTTMDALDSAGDSDVLPSGGTTTTQGFHFPLGNMAPAIPAYVKQIAEQANKRVVRRFNDANAASLATDREPGQLAWLMSNNSLQFITSSGGNPAPTTVAQVGYGTTDPPAGTYPAGFLYIKVVP